MKIGIYKITNLINGKCYIGSAINFNRRKSQHLNLLKFNKHHSKYLQRSFNKYTINNFEFKLIEECNKENLLIREQYYLDTMKPEYNNLKVAGSLLGFKFNKDSRNKMKESFKKVNKEKKEYILKRRLEVIQKPMLQYDLQGNFIKEWKSLKEYEDITGLLKTNISTVLKGKRKSANGFIFKYK